MTDDSDSEATKSAPYTDSIDMQNATGTKWQHFSPLESQAKILILYKKLVIEIVDCP